MVEQLQNEKQKQKQRLAALCARARLVERGFFVHFFTLVVQPFFRIVSHVDTQNVSVWLSVPSFELLYSFIILLVLLLFFTIKVARAPAVVLNFRSLNSCRYICIKMAVEICVSVSGIARATLTRSFPQTINVITEEEQIPRFAIDYARHRYRPHFGTFSSLLFCI